MKNRKQRENNQETSAPADGSGVQENSGVRSQTKRKHPVRITIIAILLVIVVCAGAVFGYRLLSKKPYEEIKENGYATVRYQLPTDGSKPTDHSILENVGYMVQRLNEQEYWYSEMHSTVNTIMKQEVATYKQFSDGVLVYCDISTSSLVNTAKQFCVANGRVIWRNAAGDKST